MINFRFHLVSLVAVFLALGLGILVGSTVVDQKIVDRLDSDIARVRRENADRRDTNKQLAQENAQLREFVDNVAPYADDERLNGMSVAVVAEQGVDGDDVKDAAQALRDAGAEVPGVVWLQDDWQLDTDERVQELQTALGIDGSVSRTRETALNELADRLVHAPGSETTSTSRGPGASTSTTEPGASSVDALTQLEQAGLVRITDGDLSDFARFPSHDPSVVVVTGDASHFVGTGFTPTVVRALVATKAPTALAAVYDPGNDPETAPDRGAVLASVLDDRRLSGAVSTVDDLDLQQGRIASVLALDIQAESGEIGHYGYGEGASAPLPPHRS
jgi:copper transport outer membrane protein MctB